MSLSTIFPKGAEWRKWDLHVHTPASLVHHFQGSDVGLCWEKFISDLESLPKEFTVIGINDYLFIDGYRKILDFRKQGRLKNINTILPVVEFRIKKFAGHKEFKRINFHVIFSDQLSPDTIQSQFLNGLNGKYHLTPGLGVTWSGLITPDSLADLGRSIKANISPDKLHQFGTDLEEGYNNLNLDEEDILTLLKGSSYLKDYFVTAIGKTEWESLSWNDQSIAEKKDIINKVDFVFISSETSEACTNARRKLKEQLVNHLLLDCSDAHYNADQITQKDRIGKCFTWIKGDPTFDGLKQIKYESETRVLIQDERPEEKTSYNVIDKVRFISGSNSVYFSNADIELNPNLNVIIGGKSSGKSLLLYHIAKATDPLQVSEKLSIVNEREYDLSERLPDFDFQVLWKDNHIDSLGGNPDTKTRQITYVPQMYINHLAEQKGERKLAELIEDILDQNMMFKNFRDDQNMKIQDLNLKVGNDINELFGVLDNYLKVQRETKELGDKKAVQANIDKLKMDIAELNRTAGFSETELKDYRRLTMKKERLVGGISTAEKYKHRVQRYINELMNINSDVKEQLNFPNFTEFDDDESIILGFVKDNITDDLSKIDGMFLSIIQKYERFIETFDATVVRRSNTFEMIETQLLPFTAKITNQNLLKRLAKDILSDETKIKQIEEKERQLQVIKEAGRKLKQEILESIDVLNQSYQDVLTKIKEPELSQIGIELRLDTSLHIDIDAFQNSFCNLLDGRSNFQTLFGSAFDDKNNYVFETASHVSNLKTIFEKVWNAEANQIKFRSGYTMKDGITQLLRDHYVFKYNIKYKGDDILQMSPGKRGLVLLQIILHLSNAKHPILIDQPEDNLDNRTIFNDLNEFIKEKKTQRQIILVTHNANLVVSTDAEEVIIANQTGQDAGKSNERYQFEYLSGSLENTFKNPGAIGILNQLGVREHVCDILEGGERAFIYRERKYGFRN